MSDLEKEYYYNREAAKAWANNKKIKSKYYTLLAKHYGNKHLKNYLKK